MHFGTQNRPHPLHSSVLQPWTPSHKSARSSINQSKRKTLSAAPTTVLRLRTPSTTPTPTTNRRRSHLNRQSISKGGQRDNNISKGGRKSLSTPAATNPLVPYQHKDQLTNAVVDPATWQLLECRHLIKTPHTCQLWEQSASNEFGRLRQGLKRGASKAPTPCTSSSATRYLNANTSHTQNIYVPENERTQITIADDRIDYPGEVATKPAESMMIKCLLNIVTSTKMAALQQQKSRTST